MFQLPQKIRPKQNSCANLGLLFFLWFTLFTMCAGAEQTTAPSGYAPGNPWTGSSAIQERNADIMAREKQTEARARLGRGMPRFRPDFQNLQQNPESPDVSSWPAAGVP